MGKVNGLVSTVLLCSLVWALISSTVEAGEGQKVKDHYLRSTKPEVVEDKKFKFCEPPPPVNYPPPYVNPPPYSPSPDYSPPYSPSPDYKSPPYSPSPVYKSPSYLYKSAVSHTSPSPPY